MRSLTKSTKIFSLIFAIYIKRNWQIILAAVFTLVLISFIQIKFRLIDFNEYIISEGLVGTYQEHDLPEEVTKLLSGSLVKVDEVGIMVGDLASGWETNNDATVFKFKLKNGIKWTDKTDVKSSDLAFSIPAVEISYPDDSTVQFKLKESYSPFPSLLTKPIFKRGTLVGTGPYKIVKIEKSKIFITKLILEAESSELPKIVLRFYPNEKIAQTGLSLGEVQSLIGVSSVDEFRKNPIVKIHQQPDSEKIITILYNTKDPVLSNKYLRQSLSFSTPKIEGESEAKTSIPTYSWAFNDEVKQYLSNPEKARETMEKAKSNSSSDMIKKELVLTTTPQLEYIGKQVVSSWKQLGLNAVLQVESGIPQNFQALLITQSIPKDPDQYFLWHSTQEKTNLTKYSSARVDKDLEDSRKLINQEERKAKYMDFQKVLMEDSPATFLYFPKYSCVYMKKVEEPFFKILNLQSN